MRRIAALIAAVAVSAFCLSANATDLHIRGTEPGAATSCKDAAANPKNCSCVELVDPTTGDFLQSAPGDWTAGTAPAGEVRLLFDTGKNNGVYANTTNQGEFIDEGTACVYLTKAELQKEHVIAKWRGSSGCPCAYIPTAVYVQTISHKDAFHDATPGQ